MSIKELLHGDVVVLTPGKSLIGDNETSQLRERTKELISEGFLKVVLDLDGVTWVNSSGLGAMIAAYTSLNKIGGDLRLANITDKIESLFLITQLVKVFKTYENIERAVASYQIDPISEKQSSD